MGSEMCIRDRNYTGGQAFVVKRALVFVTAIALYLGICIGVIGVLVRLAYVVMAGGHVHRAS